MKNEVIETTMGDETTEMAQVKQEGLFKRAGRKVGRFCKKNWKIGAGIVLGVAAKTICDAIIDRDSNDDANYDNAIETDFDEEEPVDDVED